MSRPCSSCRGSGFLDEDAQGRPYPCRACKAPAAAGNGLSSPPPLDLRGVAVLCAYAAYAAVVLHTGYLEKHGRDYAAGRLAGRRAAYAEHADQLRRIADNLPR